jgi:hypothetical protein
MNVEAYLAAYQGVDDNEKDMKLGLVGLGMGVGF